MKKWTKKTKNLRKTCNNIKNGSLIVGHFFTNFIMSQKSAYETSLNLLARRNYSEYKLRKKLLEKKYPEEEINASIKKLIEKKFLREDEYIRMKISNFLTRGYGDSYIVNKLKEERIKVTKDEINILREEFSKDEDSELEKLIHKKLNGKSLPNDPLERLKLKSKVLYFLVSKGHDYSKAKDLLNKSMKTPDQDSF